MTRKLAILLFLLFPLVCFADGLTDYQVARALHYKDGNHTAAIAAFEQFLAQYPDSKYATEAKLDLVRLYFVQIFQS